MWSVGARVEVQWADGYQSVEDAPPVEAVGMTAEDEPLQLAGHDEPWAARAAETAGAAEVAASDQEEVTASASNSRKRARVTFEQHNIAMPLPTCTKAFDLGAFGTVLAQAAPATVRWQEAAAAARQRAIQQGQPTLLLLGDAFRLPNRTWKGYAHGSSPCVLDGFVEKFAWDDGPGPAYIVRTVEDGWHYPFPPDKLAEHAAVTPPAVLEEEEEMDYDEEEEMGNEGYEDEYEARVEPDAVAYDAAEPDGEDVAADQSHAALVSESHGIRLHLSRKSLTGYKGVHRRGLHRYRSQITTGGSDIINLGMYDTAVEAAVAYARAAPSPPKALPEVTEVDGIRLHLSSKCTSGYMGVYLRSSGRYEVKIWLGGKGGKWHQLGTYDTAVEGALAYARAAQSHKPEEEDDDVERGPKSDQAKLVAMKSATFGLLPPLATLPLRPPSCFLETDVFKRRAFLEVERLGVGAWVTAKPHISSYLKCPQVYESNGSLGKVARHSRIVFRAQRHGETRLAYQWEWRNHILDELSANFQHTVVHS